MGTIIKIFHEEVAKRYNPANNSVIIRALNPCCEGKYIKLPNESKYSDVLVLYFTDARRSRSSNQNNKFFSKEDAINIVKFFRRYKNIDEIIVHCTVGETRSPGIALALAYYLEDLKKAKEIIIEKPNFHEEVYYAIKKEIDKEEIISKNRDLIEKLISKFLYKEDQRKERIEKNKISYDFKIISEGLDIIVKKNGEKVGKTKMFIKK